MKRKPLKAIHLKTGKVYDVLNIGIDCTNERDGLKIIIYTDGWQIFVRELKEFSEKFKALDDGELK